MCCEKENLIPKDSNLQIALKNVREKSKSRKKITKNFTKKFFKINFKKLKNLFISFDKRTTVFLLVFILLMCVKTLEARPSVSGLQPEETKSEKHDSLFNAQNTEYSHSKSSIKLAEPDGEVPIIERYPVSQVDFGHVKTPFIIGAWILSASLAKIIFHMTPKLHKIVPESCLLILVGVGFGVIMLFTTNVFVSPLTPNTFFLYMLPPIILDAGYFMPNRKFFDNLGTILLMAVVGTIFNIVTIGGSLWLCGLTGIYGIENTPGFLDIFLFASLISAVDPVAVLAVFEQIKVNEVLYIVVFGESLLNDAVTVVMYHMMEAYDEIGVENIIAEDILSGVASFFVVALGGTFIGIIWGFLLGFITRFTHHVRIIEPIFVFLMAYLSYLNAEMFHMSGILAITFCGITSKNYVESNISPKSQTTIKYALKMLSNSSETIIFMFLGVASVHSSHLWNTWFVILTISFCTVFRSLGVILFSALANRFRLHKLSSVDQFVMSYGGLRGAVAFALVLLIDERIVKQKDMFVTTTIAVIYFTVFIQGITIKPLVELLNVKRANKKELTMNERINERFIDHVMAGIEDIIGHNGNYNLRDKFRRLNDRFIRPLLIRDLESAERKFLKTYSTLTLRDAMAIMQRSPSSLAQMLDTDSLCGSFRNYSINMSRNSSDHRLSLEAPFSRYIDLHELDYYPSKRDIFDAEIHHLRVEQYRPYKNRPEKTKSRKLSSTTNERSSKIRFRRYITNRKHLKFLQHGSIHSDNSDKMQQNLVSFSDQKKKNESPQVVRIAAPNEKNLENNDENYNDEGLTLILKPKTPENTISQASSIGENINSTENNSYQLPWRESTIRKQGSIRHEKPPIWTENKQGLTCDTTKYNLQGLLEKTTATLPFIDSTSSNLDSTSIEIDDKNVFSFDSSKNCVLKTSNIDLNNHKNNAASQENPPHLNKQPISYNELPISCEDEEEAQEKQELSEELSFLLTARSHKKYEKDEKIEVTMTLLNKSSSEYDEDEDEIEDIDKYYEL